MNGIFSVALVYYDKMSIASLGAKEERISFLAYSP